MTQSTEQERAQALAEKHGATSYRNRADTQNPAYGFTPTQLAALIDVVEQEARRAQVVPQGWKLVPMEPTPEQLLKVYKQTGVSRKELADLWTAMLAAAPQPPEVQP